MKKDYDYIEICIYKSSKSYYRGVSYGIYDQEILKFKDNKDLRKYLNETYGKCKTTPMFQDTKDGTTEKVGIVKSFRNCIVEHGIKQNFIEEHWITINKLKIIK